MQKRRLVPKIDRLRARVSGAERRLEKALADLQAAQDRLQREERTLAAYLADRAARDATIEFRATDRDASSRAAAGDTGQADFLLPTAEQLARGIRAPRRFCFTGSAAADQLAEG